MEEEYTVEVSFVIILEDKFISKQVITVYVLWSQFKLVSTL